MPLSNGSSKLVYGQYRHPYRAKQIILPPSIKSGIYKSISGANTNCLLGGKTSTKPTPCTASGFAGSVK